MSRLTWVPENQKLLAATAAAANKIFFQLTAQDAQDLAPEFVRPEQTVNEVAAELANLRPFTAYAKVIQERDREQIVLKRKIQTFPLPPAI